MQNAVGRLRHLFVRDHGVEKLLMRKTNRAIGDLRASDQPLDVHLMTAIRPVKRQHL
jgi:hypothetical protein